MFDKKPGLRILLIISLLAAVLAMIFGCSPPPAGEVHRPKVDAIEINNKIHDIRYVTIDDYGHGIYILIPRDSTQLIPEVTTRYYKNGKSTINQTVVKIQ